MGAPSWFERELVEGDEGDDVLIVQRKVGAPMSGVMDASTMARVRGFQRVRGLVESGTVTVETASAVGEKASRGRVPDWFVRDLAGGATGVDVAALRVALRVANLPDYFDDVLEARVRQFQAAAGLQPTGVVDVATAVALGDRSA